MSEQTTPPAGDTSTWTFPVPNETEGPLPSPESIAAGGVYALWHEPIFESTDTTEYLGWVEICFPTVGRDDAHFSGDVVVEQRYWDDDERVKAMHAGTVILPRELEGHKLGEKLVRGLIHEAVKTDCVEMDVDFKHPASFKAFVSIVGFDRMNFYDQSGRSRLTEEEMLARIAEGYGPVGSRPQRLMHVRSNEATIDLQGLDITGWETPQEFQVPAEADAW